MTQQDKSVLTKELRGLTLQNIAWAVGLVVTCIGIAYNHYGKLMGKLEGIERQVIEVRVNQKFQQQMLDRHEQILTTDIK